MIKASFANIIYFLFFFILTLEKNKMAEFKRHKIPEKTKQKSLEFEQESDVVSNRDII